MTPIDLDCLRSAEHAATLRTQLRALDPGRHVRIMEVCGTHTMAVYRNGLSAFWPERVELVSGPGCPVCVTDQETIDRAVAYAETPGVQLAVFGDMLRVPGSRGSLEQARGRGARVSVVTSPLDTLELARRAPETLVVFFGIGFETTAAGVAAFVEGLARTALPNLVMLTALKRVPPALESLAGSGKLAIDAFLCPGHVSAVIGTRAYEFLATEHRRPCVVAGFEPIDVLLAIGMLLRQLRDGRAEVENEYARVVARDGNRRARELIDRVFEPATVPWRGLGLLPDSGLRLREAYAGFDAERRFPIEIESPRRVDGCACGAVIRGALRPAACEHFARACTPATPLGPCMVSSEGACAAHLRYGVDALGEQSPGRSEEVCRV